MKFLFDENLSPALPRRLSELAPGSAHVREVGLLGEDDILIWRFAAKNSFIIVTKDDDYSELSILHGAPPKVLLLRIGNCSTTEIVQFIIGHLESIRAFSFDVDSALHEISKSKNGA
jgi:predicted nuclease of predicted toxin-antitoxin system